MLPEPLSFSEFQPPAAAGCLDGLAVACYTIAPEGADLLYSDSVAPSPPLVQQASGGQSRSAVVDINTLLYNFSGT